MIDKILKEAEDRMQKSIAALKTELGKIRTGRAHAGLLDSIRVNYYGSESPLNQVATISVEGPRSLTITPYDKSMVPMIEKAIMTSDLGLNPTTAGVVIRVPLPALTEQRRKELAKLVKEECERGRVSVRSIRREANQEIKDLLKQKTISEDDERRAEAQIQKVTDQYITKVDDLSVQKEKDLMEI